MGVVEMGVDEMGSRRNGMTISDSVDGQTYLHQCIEAEEMSKEVLEQTSDTLSHWTAAHASEGQWYS